MIHAMTWLDELWNENEKRKVRKPKKTKKTLLFSHGSRLSHRGAREQELAEEWKLNWIEKVWEGDRLDQWSSREKQLI